MEEKTKRQYIEYTVVAGLVIVALIIGISKFKKTEKNDEVFSRKEFNEKWKEVEILEASVPKSESAVDYTQENEAGPFKSPFDDFDKEGAEEIVVLPDLDFQGMVWKSFRPQVIIGNKVYEVNDYIEADKEKILIKDVDHDGIHLKYKGREFIVRPKIKY